MPHASRGWWGRCPRPSLAGTSAISIGWDETSARRRRRGPFSPHAAGKDVMFLIAIGNPARASRT
jgi:hypothetical protein